MAKKTIYVKTDRFKLRNDVKKFTRENGIKMQDFMGALGISHNFLNYLNNKNMDLDKLLTITDMIKKPPEFYSDLQSVDVQAKNKTAAARAAQSEKLKEHFAKQKNKIKPPPPRPIENENIAGKIKKLQCPRCAVHFTPWNGAGDIKLCVKCYKKVKGYRK